MTEVTQSKLLDQFTRVFCKMFRIVLKSGVDPKKGLFFTIILKITSFTQFFFTFLIFTKANVTVRSQASQRQNT